MGYAHCGCCHCRPQSMGRPRALETRQKGVAYPPTRGAGRPPLTSARGEPEASRPALRRGDEHRGQARVEPVAGCPTSVPGIPGPGENPSRDAIFSTGATRARSRLLSICAHTAGPTLPIRVRNAMEIILRPPTKPEMMCVCTSRLDC